MRSKSSCRIKFKKLRNSLNIKNISENLVNTIRNNEVYKKSNNIMLFYPLKSEIDLLDLLNDNKNFYFPKVCNNDLLVCPYKIGDKLIKSEFNVLEPKSKPIDCSILDLIFVPALCVDKNNYRLGYGKGFYDRFLPKCKNAHKVVAIPKELIIDELPNDDFDIKVDEIICF